MAILGKLLHPANAYSFIVSTPSGITYLSALPPGYCMISVSALLNKTPSILL